MTLKEYFNETTGTGVLATSDNEGRVDAAIYSRPHILENGSLAFIMRERLTLNNIRANPYATYLFMEQSGQLRGLRLFLEKTGEDYDDELIRKMLMTDSKIYSYQVFSGFWKNISHIIPPTFSYII